MARGSYDSLYGEDVVQRKRGAKTGYSPLPIAETADTGIPAPTDLSYTPPEDGGFVGRHREVDTGVPSYTQPTPTAPDDTLVKLALQQMMKPASKVAAPAPQTTTAPTTPAQPAPYAQYAMPGWEQSKWADPSHNTIKYQAGRIFSQFDPNAIRQNPAPLLAALKAAGLNVTMVGDDKIDFGDGFGPIDVITSGGQWAWQPTVSGAGGDSQNPAGSMGGPATAQSFQQSLFQAAQGALGGQTGGAVGQTGQTGQTGETGANGGPAFDEAVRQMVLRLMRQQPTDITNDPVYQSAMSAYGQQQQRAKERNRNAIAERAAAQGTLNTGGFSDRVLGAEQAQGEAEATFAGNLGIRELERQRDEVMQALQIGAGLMTDEDRLALTEKLGLINAALQQQGLGLQQQGITNQNNQFNQSLGWDMSQFQWLQNMLPFLTA